MDNKTDTSTSTTEVLSEEQQAAADTATREEREAEEAFAAGFKKVAKAEEPTLADKDQDTGKAEQTDTTVTNTTSEKSDAEKEADEKAKAEAERKKAADDAAAKAKAEYDALPQVLRDTIDSLKDLPGQVRKLAGNLGGLKSQLDSAVATAKAAATKTGGAAAAPSDATVKAAMADPKAWEKLKEDFPDWAGPMEAELNAMRAEIEIAKKGGAAPVDVKALKAEVASEVRAALVVDIVEDAHEGWQTTVKTPEFKAWHDSQPENVKALAASDRPRDAIKLLDGFKSHQEQQVKAKQDQDAKNRRLERAAPAKGSSAAPDPGISDDAAFVRGFKKVAGKKA